MTLENIQYSHSSAEPTDETLQYWCDNQRHLVCTPYSIPNLHRMAKELGIKRCWFHKDHYDIPKGRYSEILSKAISIRPRGILRIIKGDY